MSDSTKRKIENLKQAADDVNQATANNGYYSPEELAQMVKARFNHLENQSK